MMKGLSRLEFITTHWRTARIFTEAEYGSNAPDPCPGIVRLGRGPCKGDKLC